MQEMPGERGQLETCAQAETVAACQRGCGRVFLKPWLKVIFLTPPTCLSMLLMASQIHPSNVQVTNN